MVHYKLQLFPAKLPSSVLLVHLNKATVIIVITIIIVITRPKPAFGRLGLE